MLFKDFLNRSTCRVVENFILNGGEWKDTSPDLPLDTRLKNAEEALHRFFRLHCTSDAETEYILDKIYEPISDLEAAYFEAGMLAGAKLAFEIRGKMDEITCKEQN